MSYQLMRSFEIFVYITSDDITEIFWMLLGVLIARFTYSGCFCGRNRSFTN